jgi:hypothetical protein
VPNCAKPGALRSLVGRFVARVRRARLYQRARARMVPFMQDG